MGDQALMPFTVAVVHEVQRFADIIPLGLPHMTTRDIEVQGFYVPKVGLRLSQPHLPTTCHLVAAVSVARSARTGIQATLSSWPQVLNVPAWVGVDRRAEQGWLCPLRAPGREGRQTRTYHSIGGGRALRGSKGTLPWAERWC